jgi:hypothetical protein
MIVYTGRLLAGGREGVTPIVFVITTATIAQSFDQLF